MEIAYLEKMRKMYWFLQVRYRKHSQNGETESDVGPAYTYRITLSPGYQKGVYSPSSEGEAEGQPGQRGYRTGPFPSRTVIRMR